VELRLDPSRRVADVVDRDDFRRFHVVAVGGDVAEVLAAFSEVISAGDNDHVWVRARSVIAWNGDAAPAWIAGFRAMLASVESLGWYDPESDAVKAHVEVR
jgi:hypothetical protein